MPEITFHSSIDDTDVTSVIVSAPIGILLQAFLPIFEMLIVARTLAAAKKPTSAIVADTLLESCAETIETDLCDQEASHDRFKKSVVDVYGALGDEEKAKNILWVLESLNSHLYKSIEALVAASCDVIVKDCKESYGAATTSKIRLRRQMSSTSCLKNKF